MAQAINEPHKICVIRLDDTEAVSLPHPGNRIPKDLCSKNGPEVTSRYSPVGCVVTTGNCIVGCSVAN